MHSSVIRVRQNLAVDIDALTRLILDQQRENGEIPWCDGQKTDPWDHVESAIGLTIGGHYAAARRAYEWMRRNPIG